VKGEEKNAMLLVNASVASAVRSLLSLSGALEPDGQVKKGEVLGCFEESIVVF
jgi:hypothetical protein